LGYDEWWKTLESLIAEFRKRNVAIPDEAMTSLKSAKTLINVYKADSSRVESIPDIENCLLDVESTLINMVKERLGQDAMERWMEKLEKARKERPKVEAAAARFIPGLPKDKHWIRVLLSDDILKEDVEKIADALGLSRRVQDDGFLLVYGDKEKVRSFIKKMAEKCRPTRKS
jgi:hypothetical protein